MHHPNIRSATLKDIPVLLQFEQGVIAAERPFDPTLKSTYTTYYNLEELINATHVKLLVVELNGEPVATGYARIEKAKEALQHDRYGYLGFMYTVPQHRGKGLNQLIIKELVAWCGSKGVTEIRLEVYQDNIPAIKAYEKVGFEKHLILMRLKNKSGSSD